MKPAVFDYARPSTLAEALAMLAATPQAMVLAGGQTLGPMLNLRLAQPALLIDITRIAELASVGEDGEAFVIGATVTHSAIEDQRIKDPSDGLLAGFLARVAGGIGYRAVRTRGTIGGSLANADPAADWLACLTALDAELLIASQQGRRRVPLAAFVHGAMHSDLAHDELILAVRLPRFSRAARFGFHKICRKSGEFADAIGVAVRDPERARYRLVVSTAAGAPKVLESNARPDPASIKRLLIDAGFDGFDLNVSAAALRRALAAAEAA
jgi:aerobic carbon-monoxide dehydrogenase medium subunit